jgi:hypothetical protein
MMKKALILIAAAASMAVSGPASAKWADGGIWAGKTCGGVKPTNPFYFLIEPFGC